MHQLVTTNDPSAVYSLRIFPDDLPIIMSAIGVSKTDFAALLEISKQNLHYYINNYQGGSLPSKIADRINQVLADYNLSLTPEGVFPIARPSEPEQTLKPDLQPADKPIHGGCESAVPILLEIRDLLEKILAAVDQE